MENHHEITIKITIFHRFFNVFLKSTFFLRFGMEENWSISGVSDLDRPNRSVALEKWLNSMVFSRDNYS